MSLFLFTCNILGKIICDLDSAASERESFLPPTGSPPWSVRQRGGKANRSPGLGFPTSPAVWPASEGLKLQSGSAPPSTPTPGWYVEGRFAGAYLYFVFICHCF